MEKLFRHGFMSGIPNLINKAIVTFRWERFIYRQLYRLSLHYAFRHIANYILEAVEREQLHNKIRLCRLRKTHREFIQMLTFLNRLPFHHVLIVTSQFFIQGIFLLIILPIVATKIFFNAFFTFSVSFSSESAITILSS